MDTRRDTLHIVSFFFCKENIAYSACRIKKIKTACKSYGLSRITCNPAIPRGIPTSDQDFGTICYGVVTTSFPLFLPLCFLFQRAQITGFAHRWRDASFPDARAKSIMRETRFVKLKIK